MAKGAEPWEWPNSKQEYNYTWFYSASTFAFLIPSPESQMGNF